MPRVLAEKRPFSAALKRPLFKTPTIGTKTMWLHRHHETALIHIYRQNKARRVYYTRKYRSSDVLASISSYYKWKEEEFLKAYIRLVHVLSPDADNDRSPYSHLKH